MGYRYIQSQQNSDFVNPAVASFATTLGAAVGVGNLLVGSVTWFQPTTEAITSVTTDKGDTATLGFKIGGAGQQDHQVFYFGNLTSAPSVITVHFSPNAADWGLVMAEYSGVRRIADPKDVAEGQRTNGFPAGTNSIATSASGTATAKADLVVGFLMQDGDGTPTTIDGGTSPQTFTERQIIQGGGYINMILEEYFQSTPANARATFTPNATVSTDDYAVIMTAFLPEPIFGQPTMTGLGAGGPFYPNPIG